MNNKKVLLRDRKRHTARRVAGPWAVPTLAGGGWGVSTLDGVVPTLQYPSFPHPDLVGGGAPTFSGGYLSWDIPLSHPDLAGGYLPWLGGYLPWPGGHLPWLGGVPTLDGGTYLGVPPAPILTWPGGNLPWLGV